MSKRIAATTQDSCSEFILKVRRPSANGTRSKPVRRPNDRVGAKSRPNDGAGGGVFHEMLHALGNGSGGASTKDAPDALLLLGLTSALQLARRWIQAAHANLTSALAHVDASENSGGLPTFSRAERLRLANRYFHIDEFPARNRRFMLERVRAVYTTMLQVFERPGGLWGERAFAIDSTGMAYGENHTAVAHTDHSGFFKGGKPNQFQAELRADTIFFVRENIAYFAKYPQSIKTIVHEMAHFCGDERVGWAILDFDAYGEPDAPAMARLKLEQRVRHADTYARFAQAAGT